MDRKGLDVRLAPESLHGHRCGRRGFSATDFARLAQEAKLTRTTAAAIAAGKRSDHGLGLRCCH